jgi:quinol monooxygenase YgiN
MITHSVYFNLKHSKDSAEEAAFLKKAIELNSISSVRHFKCVREVSPKNEYKFGLIMQFEDQTSYDFYNEHPDHKNFVENVWIPEVEDFIEIDYYVIFDHLTLV